MSDQMPRVPFIGLCGHPRAGKNEVQKLLLEEFQVEPYDDGVLLRDFAMRLFGLSREDVATQEGKAREILVASLGRKMTVRQALGYLGDALEGTFGDRVLAEASIQDVWSRPGSHVVYSFSSVRKSQGWSYRERGGVIVEVRRPGYGPSGNGFDLWDQHAVTHVLDNDGSREALRGKVKNLFGPLLGVPLKKGER